jgi:GDPmannose 4,6-dehydratase
VARIALGLEDTITLGNLDARRDWGHAADYVKAMHLMLQQPEPRDYVIATGEQHSIADCLDIAFGHVGIQDWQAHISSDPRFKRPAELHSLCGDASRARSELGWQPEIQFADMIREMVDADMARLRA